MRNIGSLVAVLVLAANIAAQTCTSTVSAPNTETFDTATTGSFTTCTSTSSPGVLPAGWTLDASSTTPWVVNTGGTGSTNTGPSADFTSGTGNYLYVEISGTCNGLEAVLNSPCYDVTGINPNVTFAYHMFGPDVGRLRVQSFDGTAWVTIFEITGDQGNQWNTRSLGMFTYMNMGVPTAALRFLCEDDSGTLFTGDVAIDQIVVENGPLSPPTLEWQENPADFAITIDGREATALNKAIVTKDLFQCVPVVPESATFELFSTLVGTPYDIAFNSSPTLGGNSGGFPLPDGQFLNLDIGGGLFFLSTGTASAGSLSLPFAALPGASSVTISVPLSLDTPGTTSLQGYVLDGAALLGFRLSQATQMDVVSVPIPTMVPGPTLTTTNVEINVQSAPTCWAAGGVPFYGTNYSSFFVSPNGFLAFGAGGDTDTTPSVLDALADDARVGFWTDLDPSEGGTVTVSNPMPDVIRVDWNGVFYNTGGPANTFGIEIDCISGIIIIDNLAQVSANPGTSTTDDQWLGMSPGLGVATDGGPTTFTVGGSGGVLAPTDMLYDFNDTSVSLTGIPASIRGGIGTIIFTPDGFGNYVWAAL